MGKTIVLQLSEKGIDEAITVIKNEKKAIEKKVKKLIEIMVKEGEGYAVNAISNHVYTGETLSSIIGYREGNKGFILAHGAAVWLEFGTGVRYNPRPYAHPKAEALGISPIGEYGDGNGKNPNGWYYLEDGKKRHTFGIKATKFMFYTAKYLREKFPKLAKEVFDD